MSNGEPAHGRVVAPALYVYMMMKPVLCEDYFRQLAKKGDITADRLPPSTMNFVSICQAPIGASISPGCVILAQKDGIPIDWLRLSHIPTTGGAFAISANAPHPNAAKLFLDFMLRDAARIAIADSPPDYRMFPALSHIHPHEEMLSGLDIVGSD